MTRQVRRIVTGHNGEGQSTVISDRKAHNITTPIPAVPEFTLINLWRSDSSPADVIQNSDPTLQPVPLSPPATGSVLRMVDFPPESTYIHHLTDELRTQAWAAMQANEFADPAQKPVHPLMHRTPTLDYGIILEGEIYLILDDSEHLMKTGDVVIQRATNHAWSNRSDKICRVAFILLDAAKQ